MILQRYLLKDIFSHTGAVGLVFLLVIMASRSIQYLEQVSRGELSPEIVFWVILLRLPEFLELIIPFSLFISLVLVIGKLSSNNELIILEQNGYSDSKIIKLFLSIGLFFGLLTCLFSFWVTPLFKKSLDDIFDQTSFQDDFYSIQPGKFTTLDGNSVFYAEDKIDGVFLNIFLKIPSAGLLDTKRFLIAKRSLVTEDNPNLITFEEGSTFSKEGNNQIEMRFESLTMDVSSTLSSNEVNPIQSYTSQHLSSTTLWKISMPLLCVVIVFIALPLGRVAPRQGRYSKVLPSVLVFLIYLGLLILIKGWLDEGKMDFAPSLLLVHFSFLLLGFFLLYRFSMFRGK